MRTAKKLVLACALCAAALSTPSFSCLADLFTDKATLVKKYGNPDKTPLPGLTGISDEGLAFAKDELIIHVYFKKGKACSVVYGHKKAGEQILQTELLMLLNQSSNGATWQPQTITEFGVVNYARSDGNALASYDGNDKRPCLNVMAKEVWEALNALKAKAEAGKKRKEGQNAEPAKAQPAPQNAK